MQHIERPGKRPRLKRTRWSGEKAGEERREWGVIIERTKNAKAKSRNKKVEVIVTGDTRPNIH